MKRDLWVLFLAFQGSLAFAAPQVTQVNVELDMKDFHDATVFSGSLRPGIPVTLTFKNNVVVKLIPMALEDNVIKFTTQIVKDSGSVLYNASFITRYNADVELSEKRPNGDLVYHLRLNPHTAQR